MTCRTVGSLHGLWLWSAFKRLLRIPGESRTVFDWPWPFTLDSQVSLWFLKRNYLPAVTIYHLSPPTVGRLSGPNIFPGSFGELKALTQLDLAYNGISSLPGSIGQLTVLTLQDLSDNHFVGPIPSCIGSLTAVFDLRLSGNLFSGAFPDWIGQLKRLNTLDPSSSKFTGTLLEPMRQLTGLTKLKVLRRKVAFEIHQSKTFL